MLRVRLEANSDQWGEAGERSSRKEAAPSDNSLLSVLDVPQREVIGLYLH